MGTDTPLAVLSDRPRLVFDYFAQLFAQVTNPPLDAIREELVTSLGTITGPEQNLLEPLPASCRQMVLPYPVISNSDLAKIVDINDEGSLPGLASHVVDGRYDPRGGGEGLRARLAEICAEVSAAIASGARLIVFSDRMSTSNSPVPIPSLLLTGAVHHHLIREKITDQGGADRRGGGRPRVPPRGAARSGTAPRPSIPTWPSPSARDLVRRGVLDRDNRAEGRGQPDQGARQGAAEDHVQDGRVHRGLLHRRADLRGHRPRAPR